MAQTTIFTLSMKLHAKHNHLHSNQQPTNKQVGRKFHARQFQMNTFAETNLESSNEESISPVQHAISLNEYTIYNIHTVTTKTRLVQSICTNTHFAIFISTVYATASQQNRSPTLPEWALEIKTTPAGMANIAAATTSTPNSTLVSPQAAACALPAAMWDDYLNLYRPRRPRPPRHGNPRTGWMHRSTPGSGDYQAAVAASCCSHRRHIRRPGPRDAAAVTAVCRRVTGRSVSSLTCRSVPPLPALPPPVRAEVGQRDQRQQQTQKQIRHRRAATEHGRWPLRCAGRLEADDRPDQDGRATPTDRSAASAAVAASRHPGDGRGRQPAMTGRQPAPPTAVARGPSPTGGPWRRYGAVTRQRRGLWPRPHR